MKKKSILVLLIAFILHLFVMHFIQPQYIFTTDSLIKLTQSYGLLNSNFSSESIEYLGKDIDPSYTYSPFKGSTLRLIQINNNYIGPFPVAFSLLSAIYLKVFQPHYLPFLSLFFTWVGLIFFYIKWSCSLKASLLILFCTPLFIVSFDYAEYTLFAVLHFIGLSLLLQSTEKTKIVYLCLSGLFMGISVFFRIEAILFTFSLCLSYLLMYKVKINKQFLIPIVITFLIFLLFFVFNYLTYNHILGTRFTVNESGFFADPIQKFNNILTLLVFNNMKLGLLVTVPMLLFIFGFLYKIDTYKKIQPSMQILLNTTSIFIILVLLLSPNDGGNLNWGSRYFLLIFFPVGLLFHYIKENFSISNKKLIYLVNFLITLSILVNIVMTLVVKASTGAFKQIQNQFIETDTDVWLFISDDHVYFIGLEYFHKKVFLLDNSLINKNDVLYNLVKKHYSSDSRICFFTTNYNKIQNISKETKQEQIVVEKIVQELNQKFRFIEKKELQHHIGFIFQNINAEK